MNNELGIMNNGKKRSFHLSSLILFFILYSLFFILYSSQAFAEAASLAITPPVITLQTQAPAFIEKTFSIQNRANAPIDLVVTYLPFTQTEVKDGIPSYDVDTNAFFAKDQDIFKKIQILDGDTPVDTLTLSAKQEKKLRLQITIPTDEPDADYYFSILFVSKDTNSNETTPTGHSGLSRIDSGVAEAPQNDAFKSIKAISSIQPGIAAHVLLSIMSSQKQPEGIIQDYTAPLFVAHGPVPLVLTFKNTGSYLLTPQGTVLITNMFGQTVGKVSIPKTNVLKYTKRAIPIVWNEGFLLGPYQAKLYLTFADRSGDPKASFTRSLIFIGIPAPLIGGIIGLIIVAILLWIRIKKYLA